MLWTETLASFKSWMENKTTTPILAETVVTYMGNLRNNQPPREQQEKNCKWKKSRFNKGD